MSSRTFNEKSTAEEVATALKDNIRGKNVLLVGAAVGSLGGEFLRVIAPYAKTVWLAGRRKERLQVAVDEASESLPFGASLPIVHLIEMDTTSFESVRAAAAKINAQEQPIDVLIQNVLSTQSMTLQHSVDDHELQLAGNHLGTFQLVSLLLPCLRRAGPGARVVAVSSMAHAMSPIRWDDPDFTLRPEEYAIVTNGAHAIPKEWLVQYNAVLPDGTFNPAFFTKSIPEGVATYVAAAFDPTIQDKSGAYLEDGVVHKDRLATSVTEEAAVRLWALSERLVGIKFL